MLEPNCRIGSFETSMLGVYLEDVDLWRTASSITSLDNDQKQRPKPLTTSCQGQSASITEFLLYTPIWRQLHPNRSQRKNISLYQRTIFNAERLYWKLEDQVSKICNFFFLLFSLICLDFILLFTTCANEILAKCSLAVSTGKRRTSPFGGTSVNSEKYSSAR